MAGRNDDLAARLLRGAIGGAVAGAVASFAMDRFQAATASLIPKPDGEPATQQAADAVARAATGKPVPKARKPLAGQAVHYAVGVALGAAYGIAAEFRPSVTAGYGTAFGVGTATLLDEAMVPAVGLGDPPWQADVPTTLYGYASHLVFGLVAETVRRQIAALRVVAA